MNRIRVVVRRVIAGAGADPVAVAVARIATARRVVVPLAPVHFAVAAAAAAEAIPHTGEDSAAEPILSDTSTRRAAPAGGRTATAGRLATNAAAARRFAAIAAGITASTGVAAAAGKATASGRRAVAAFVGAGAKPRARFAASVPRLASVRAAVRAIGARATGRLATTNVGPTVGVAAATGFTAAAAAMSVDASEDAIEAEAPAQIDRVARR